MSLTIRVLGRPSIEMDGAARTLAGQKPWSLLACLLLTPGGATRRQLAERIWPEADDPLAATRWAVLQVRRALEPEATLADEDGRLAVKADVPIVVDALEVLHGSVELDQVEWAVGGDLLEGMTFADAPDLEQWLLFERARLESASSAALRWAATLTTRRDPERALRLLGRALARDPFDDAAHELVVDVHVAGGRRAAALAHLALVERRYRDELSAEPPDSIRRPLERPSPAVRGGIQPDVATRALLEAGARRLDAGDYAGAVDVGRRATAEGAASGDELLEARALATLAGILIHSVRGRDREAVGLLDRALRLALEHDEPLLAAEVERELGYVAFLGAEYGAAESTLHRAIERSRAAGDEAGLARAMTIVGACQSDRAAFGEAEATLTEAVSRLAEARDQWEAFARSFLARVRLRAGRADDARADGALAVARSREFGWLSLVPWPMVVEAEAALRNGDRASAALAFDEAYALACEIGDPCWRSVALRGRALVARDEGDRNGAIRLLREAVDAAVSLPDVYAWCHALALVDLVELEPAPERRHLETALELARSGPMPDLLDRLDQVARRRQTSTQTPAP